MKCFIQDQLHILMCCTLSMLRHGKAPIHNTWLNSNTFTFKAPHAENSVLVLQALNGELERIKKKMAPYVPVSVAGQEFHRHESEKSSESRWPLWPLCHALWISALFLTNTGQQLCN